VATQRRNNEYYLQRLKKDHPGLYRDVLAGRVTVNKARQLAGNLGATRTRLGELKNAWLKGSPGERAEFLKWAGLITSPPAPAPAAPTAAPSLPPAFDSNGVMAAWVRRRIPEIMSRRVLTPGGLADELGIKRLDQSVMTAVRLGTRIRSSAVALAVEDWLTKNSSV
jgi:hypothetical protein